LCRFEEDAGRRGGGDAGRGKRRRGGGEAVTRGMFPHNFPRLPISPSPHLPISPSPHLPISPSPHLGVRSVCCQERGK